VGVKAKKVRRENGHSVVTEANWALVEAPAT
jgi:hypothetical protein